MKQSLDIRFSVRAAVLALALGTVSACSGVRETIGLESASPDEYQVVVRAPLSMPADFGLPAPAPGTRRPQEETTRDATRQIVLDSQGKAEVRKARPEDFKNVTPAEAVLLAKIGADAVAPDIRQVVERETDALKAENETFVESLLFWKENETPAQVVDPKAERRRLQENAALGRPAASGQTPKIERKKSPSLLDSIF